MKQKRKSWDTLATAEGIRMTSTLLKAVILIFCFLEITFSFLRRKEVRVLQRLWGYSCLYLELFLDWCLEINETTSILAPETYYLLRMVFFISGKELS